jgi:hypothetical protein
MEPQTTKVLAETKPMKSDKLLIHQGTAPPAAKNESISPADLLENERPISIIKTEKATITEASI